MSPRRTTVPVDLDAARSLAAAARTQGFSVLRLASDSVRLTVELLRHGVTPSNALELLRLVEILLRLDAVPVPLAYLELVARRWGVCDDPEVVDLLRNVGGLFGDHVAAGYGSLERLLGVLGAALPLFPGAKLSFGKAGDTWRLVLTYGGSASGKCLAYIVEEAMRRLGCNANIRLEGNALLAEATC